MKFFRWLWDEIFDEKPKVILGTLFWAFLMWIVIGAVFLLVVFL